MAQTKKNTKKRILRYERVTKRFENNNKMDSDINLCVLEKDIKTSKIKKSIGIMNSAKKVTFSEAMSATSTPTIE